MTFTFDTVAAYQAAKASGGAVYNAVADSANYAAAAVSFIKATGQTVVDAMNVIVPREKGMVGDVLLYHATSQTFSWLKSYYQTWDANSFGQTYCNAAKLASAGYTAVGFLIERVGKKCLICALTDNSTSCAWSSDTSTSIPGVNTVTSILRNDGYSTWIAATDQETAEDYFGSSIYQYTWPIPRSVWNTVVGYIKAGTDVASTSFGTDSTYTVSGGVGSITCKMTEGSRTFNPADWDYDFDKWYNHNVRAARPARSGVVQKSVGRQNTIALYNSAISTPAADLCHGYGITGVTGFTAGNWWLPSVYEFLPMCYHKRLLNKKGAGIPQSWYWTSDQYSAAYAWVGTSTNAGVYYNAKTNAGRVRAVSEFII